VQCSEAIAATADFIPSSEDLGMSMVQSIFEIDVAEGLERLAEVIANPSEPEIAGNGGAQAEVFTGFAELLNLPGFGAIATATIQALDRHPERVFEIAQLALENFRAGRSDVLNQPNSRGGHPSESLLTLANGTAPEALPESDISPASEAAIAAAAEVDLEAATDLFDSLANLDPNQAFFELGLIDPEADTTDPALENADSETDLTAAAADPLAEDFQAFGSDR
jgi:chemotaxis family two-component system sensor histidine kinase/response regulator PixL